MLDVSDCTQISTTLTVHVLRERLNNSFQVEELSLNDKTSNLGYFDLRCFNNKHYQSIEGN